MAEKPTPINRIVADNLTHWMREAGLSQTALAARARISQKTISNYLNPEQRAEGSTGKPPSAKLSELELIADALHIEVWQLTREMSESERKMYEAIEKAYADLKAGLTPAPTPTPPGRRGFPDAFDVARKETAVATVSKRLRATAVKKG